MLAAIVSTACSAHHHAPADASGVEVDSAAGGFALGSFAGGFDDRLVLPPSFATSLPLAGEEVTRESPGLYQPGNDQFFSYAVLWWAVGPVSLATEALRSDVAIYYAGLCQSPSLTVTLGDPEAAPAVGFAERRIGDMAVGSCFGSPVPPATIEVSSTLCPDRAAILILVSPQPQSSVVWTDLRAIRDSFRCW